MIIAELIDFIPFLSRSLCIWSGNCGCVPSTRSNYLKLATNFHKTGYKPFANSFSNTVENWN